MNGAQALINTLVGNGVDVCFANPGTSEMHFVAALDAVAARCAACSPVRGRGHRRRRRLRPDGRQAGRRAAAPGPGLGNGLANLHNARRAHTPMVVVVGDHATYHKKYDAPLESDIDAAGRHRLGLGAPHRGHRATSAPTPPRPSPPAGPAGDRDADPAGRRVLDRRRQNRHAGTDAVVAPAVDDDAVRAVAKATAFR